MTVQTTERDGSRTQVLADERQPWLLIAAAAIIVAVVALVLLFGVGRPPALASLAEDPQPAPSTGVAWTSWDEDGSCVTVARPDANVEKLHCTREGGDLVGWSDEGLLVRSWRGNAEALLIIDPASGRILDRRVVDEPEGEWWGVEAVFGERDGGELVVSDADDPDRVLWRVEAPDSYEITSSSLSGDGQWIAMTDSADRLLVMPADGSAPPRVWTDEAERWTPLVWGPA